MIDYLAEAKKIAKYAFDASDSGLAQGAATVATAHAAIALVESMNQATNALIAICERMDKSVDDAEIAAIRAELARFRASRNAVEMVK